MYSFDNTPNDYKWDTIQENYPQYIEEDMSDPLDIISDIDNEQEEWEEEELWIFG